MSVVEILTQAGCRYLALSKGVKQYRVQQQSACFLILQSSSPPVSFCVRANHTFCYSCSSFFASRYSTPVIINSPVDNSVISCC